MKKILVLLLVVATSATQAANFTKGGEITQLHFWEGHSGVLILHENMINPENCARTDQYALRKEHPFFKEFYSLLLSAHLANQPLRFGLQ